MMDWIRRQCGYRFPALGGTVSRAVLGLAPRHITTELFPGIRAQLDLRDGTQRSTYWQGERGEHPTAPTLHAWARGGATAFFDIGANYGFYSFMMTARHPQLDVYAFEPNPDTFARLSTIVRENRLTRVHATAIALGEEAARLQLHPGVSDSGHSTLLPHPELTGASREVQVVPFDTWRQTQGLALPETPSWIAKIDVEGFELAVLHGMRETLAASAFAGLVVEVLPFTLALGNHKPAEIIDYLTASGYPPLPTSRTGTTDNVFFAPRPG